MKINIKNTGVKSLILLTLLTAFFGCSDDIFDKNPLSQPSDGTFWTNSNDAYMALVGCYSIGGAWRWNCFWSNQGLIWLDLMAGNGSEKELRPDDITNGNLNSSNWVVADYYNNAYSKIATCNYYLEHIDDVDMDEDLKAEYKGEVRTIRAYAYFNLALFFGDVPLTKNTMSIEEANTISRTSKDEVWNFVVTELEEAAVGLPWSRSNSQNGRITRGAALAILGRVQMAQKQWSDAAVTYKKIIDSDAHAIEQVPYGELFFEKNEQSKEFIYTTQYIPDLQENVLTVYIYPEMWGGWHQFSPYNELVKDYLCVDGLSINESPLYDKDNPYDNRDPRLDYTIMINQRTQFKGQTFVSEPGSGSPDVVTKYAQWSGYSVFKFMDPDMGSNLYNSGNNWSIIRYAEVLLSYLECQLESGATINQSLLDLTINQVRERAGMPDVSETDVTKLREIVRRERRIELAFEGVRYYDLLRWGTIADELENRQFTGMKVAKDKASNTTSYDVDDEGYIILKTTHFKRGVNELWPIPLSEREINSNLTQNTGY